MRRLFGLLLLAASMCGTMDPARVEAGMLVAKMGGVTGDGSGSLTPASDLGGVLFASGLAWTLEIEFDPATLVVSQDSSSALPSSMTLEMDGTLYTITPGDVRIEFAQFHLGYVVFLGGTNGTMAMIFATASAPGWSAESPTPTGFSGFVDFGARAIGLSTNQGLLVLRHGHLLSPTAEIVLGDAPAVPEPSVIGLAVCGSVCGLVVARRRRK
jgi:hypothetical protein